MAELELCTESALGPYLIACDRTVAELAGRLGKAGIPFEREHPGGETGDDPGSSILYLGLGANLAAVSQVLNDGDYEWEIAGL